MVPSHDPHIVTGSAVRDARLGWCSTRPFVMHGSAPRFVTLGSGHSSRFVLDSAVRYGRLGWARSSAVRYAQLGCSWYTAWSACAHGRVHGSVATHGLVVHRLNFMDMIEPCG